MIIIRFGKWSCSSQRIFRYKRLLLKNYIWTPFVEISFRYSPWYKCFRRNNFELGHINYKKIG